MLGKDLIFQSDTISIYIHWPYCVNKCPYCDFNSYVSVHDIDFSNWRKAYINDINRQAPMLAGKTIKSIFFGGGTPSLIQPELVYEIIQTIKTLNSGTEIKEITLESNPSTVEAGKFKAFKDAGVNRVSLGIQSFSDNNLRFLGRNHNTQEAKLALNTANNIFSNVSFDLINGLPHQTLTDWKHELQLALPLVTSHVSIYELTIEPNTRFYQLNVPSAPTDVAQSIFNHTISTLVQHNIFPYEISNYAKTSKESLHNLRYWLGGLYLGVGPGAHGRVKLNNDIYATVSYKNPSKWLDLALRNQSVFSEYTPLTHEQRLMELFLLNLRLYNRPIPSLLLGYIPQKHINFLLDQELLDHQTTGVFVSNKGRMQLNSLISYLTSNINL